MYRALLDVLPRLLADVDEYRSLWGPKDAALTNTEHLFDAGRITIEEQPELDLAVVRGPSAGEWHRCCPGRGFPWVWRRWRRVFGTVIDTTLPTGVTPQARARQEVPLLT